VVDRGDRSALAVSDGSAGASRAVAGTDGAADGFIGGVAAAAAFLIARAIS